MCPPSSEWVRWRAHAIPTPSSKTIPAAMIGFGFISTKTSWHATFIAGI
jgi:hypothetical protein